MIFLNTCIQSKSSIEETNDLSSNVSPSCLLVGVDALVCRNDQVSELSRRQHAIRPFLKVGQGQVVSGTDDSALVDPADQFDDDFLGTMIIDDFKLSNIAM